jgi:hypothetical protein
MTKKEVDMDIIFAAFCDFMLWSSIPILMGAGIWETHLGLSENGHTLVRLMVLLIVYGWVWFWFSSGERCKVKCQLAFRDNSQHKSPTKGNFISPIENNFLEATCVGDQKIVKNTGNESDKRNYVENH